MIAPAYTYRAELIRVIDGDTIVANLDLGFSVWVKQYLRLYGINAPEVVGEQKAAGIAAKEALKYRLGEGQVFMPPTLIVETFKDRQEKYGRYLARIWADGQDVNAWLVAQGHAAWSPA